MFSYCAKRVIEQKERPSNLPKFVRRLYGGIPASSNSATIPKRGIDWDGVDHFGLVDGMWLTIGTKEVTKAVVEATRERLLIGQT